MNAQSIIPPNIDYGKISADKYSPDETYEAGELRIQYNSLWKANQKISVPEPWTPDHWDPTTLAAELSAVNSRMNDLIKIISKTYTQVSNGQKIIAESVQGYNFAGWIRADVIGTTTFAIITEPVNQSTSIYFGVQEAVTVTTSALYIKS